LNHQHAAPDEKLKLEPHQYHSKAKPEHQESKKTSGYEAQHLSPYLLLRT
jgi:hypothetical protein